MLRKRGRRSNPWRVLLFLILIGAALYVNQVVVPATHPLFIPTAEPTRSPESFINEAIADFEAGRLPQAINAYKQAVSVDPDNASIYVALARAQLYSGQYEEALESADKAIILNNDNPMAHTFKAWALDSLGDRTQAEAAVTRAIELDANNAVAHAVHAIILTNRAISGQGDLGLIDRAAEASRLALSLDNSLMETRRARGFVLWHTGNYQESIQEYQAAVAINDRIADLHLALGYNFRAIQDYVKAVESFHQATSLKPNDPIPPLEISRTYYSIGDFAQALQYAEQAVKTDPNNPRWRANLGLMYYKNAMAMNELSHLQDAIAELSIAIQGGETEDGHIIEGMPLNYGTVAEYYAIYGLALARSNRCSEAIPIFQVILSGVPNDEVNVYNAEFGLELCRETAGESLEDDISEEDTSLIP
ncbi:MAG: tetratricopeptide repeat protein [Anaerolineales bacterium]